jgi:hypothetical protein
LELCLNETHRTGWDTKHASDTLVPTLWESKVKDACLALKKAVHGISADLKDFRDLLRR